MPPLWLNEESSRNLRFLSYLFCSLSVATLIPVLLVKVSSRRQRAFPGRLSTLFVSTCLLLHVIILSGAGVDWDEAWKEVHIGKQPPTAFCSLQGLVFQFNVSAMVWLWTSVCVSLFCVVVKGFSFERLARAEFYFHFCWLGLAVVQTVFPALIARTQNVYAFVPQLGAPYCWLSDSDYFALQLGFLHGEMLLSLIIGVALCFRVLARLLKIRNSMTEAEPYSNILASYVYRHTIFIFAFTAVFFIVVIYVFNQLWASHIGTWCVSYQMAAIHVVSVTGTGVWTAMVLGPTQANRRAIARCYSRYCVSRRMHDGEMILTETLDEKNVDTPLLNA